VDAAVAGGSDRRGTRRHFRCEDHGIVRARVRPGHEVRMVDVSAGGALIETTHRLLPGTGIELQLDAHEHRTVVRARVLRCAVVVVHASDISYRGAVCFDTCLGWLVDAPTESDSLVAEVDRSSR
jgi:hypothetical protein